MTLWSRPLLIPIGLLALITGSLSTTSGNAWAQIGPNQLPQTGAPGPTVDKPEGVAEQAEDSVDRLPTTPVLPQIKNERKRFQLLEMDGYFRFRTEWLKKFHLGFDDLGEGGAPFPLPLACHLQADDLPVGADNPCADRFKSANMRLRLEPTINITETARVHMQIDVLDNIVLGSTPDTLAADSSRYVLGAFSDTQVPPGAGRNDLGDAIRVRRAWAEVDTSLGHLSVGRQPWHWGLGIYANAGGADPFSGTYNMDAEGGDTVDRAMFRATIPGTDLQAALATDWSLTYPSSAQSDAFADRYGQAWDLDDSDDVSQWVLMITRFDAPEVFREKMAEDEWAFNYGAMLVYRTQEWATRPIPEDGEDGQTFTDTMVYRGMKTYTPDAWLKLGKGKYLFELEGVATIGSIANVSDVPLPRYPALSDTPDALDPAVTESVDVRRFGAVGRATYTTMEDKLKLGFELGYASGDQWDNIQPGAVHVRNARPLPIGAGDTSIDNFLFDPEYHVDMILFRELIGTVTNATYAKPWFSYALTEEIRGRGAGILSFANRPVATPGNGSAYGLELDADIAYEHKAFTLGVAYGVFFPMSAMDHPAGPAVGGPGFGFGDETTGNAGDASTAQTFQMRLNIRF